VKDLERYLDTNRAELLFCSAAILVEGSSETYLIPAISAAFGFDLDAYGVVVANISGTNFGPYRQLLDQNALSVPHVIITDGDPYTKGKYVGAGLKRAAKLVDEAALNDMVLAIIASDGDADSDLARVRAGRHGVFVGHFTLEPDLVSLLADEMVEAHRELEPSADLQESFAGAAAAIRGGKPESDDRKELLRRITSVSKGRYAQRLASHVQNWDPAQVTADIGVTGDDINELDEPTSMALLMTAGSYGYILAALDRISWAVRGHGILRSPAAGDTEQ
jgi:putative ATP-dependent endonuclease of OLD family